VLDYEISGREHIDAHEPCLILANHPSLIDVIFLLALFPDANCVVKAAMARNPLFYALIRSAGYISNEDPVAMICRAVDCLQAGENLIMFPEGTRTVSDSEPRFSNGAAAVAVRAGCACLPIFIRCEPTTLTRQDRWYRIPPRKVRFVAAIQPALELGTAAQQLRNQRAATAAVSARLQAYFVAGLASR